MLKQHYIRSPLNYTGSKARLLPQIIPLLPENMNIFVDIFCGSCTVSLNTTAEFVICNDRCQPLVELYRYLQGCYYEDIIGAITEIIDTMRLDTSNSNRYFLLRGRYNETHNPLDLLILLYHSFNNKIRFNRENKFNVAFGERTFTDDHRKRLVFFMKTIQANQWMFLSQDFRAIDTSMWDNEYVVYADPPYSHSDTAYNIFFNWSYKDDLELYMILDTLHSQGVRFALSAAMKINWVTNGFLANWSQKYNVYAISSNYSGANYRRVNRDAQSTEEVLVTNYEPPEQSIQKELF